MLQRDPDQRLGSKEGSREIKQHPFLQNFPWKKLDQKAIKSPFIPRREGNYNRENIEEPWKDVYNQDFIECKEALNQQSTQDYFAGYYYDGVLAEFLARQEEITHEQFESVGKRLNQYERESQKHTEDQQKFSKPPTLIDKDVFAKTINDLVKFKPEN